LHHLHTRQEWLLMKNTGAGSLRSNAFHYDVTMTMILMMMTTIISGYGNGRLS